MDEVAVVFQRRTPYVDARLMVLRQYLKPTKVNAIAIYGDSTPSPWWNNPSASDEWQLTGEDWRAALPAVLRPASARVVVIAGYSHPAMRGAATLARKGGARSILMSDSTHLDRSRHAVKEWLKGRWVRRHFDAAFVSGARAAFYVEALGIPRPRVWRGYDVVDNAHFADGARRACQAESDHRRQMNLPDRYFLYIGRFAKEKNLVGLLDAYAAYRVRIRDGAWDLVMVGNGPETQDLKARVDAGRIAGVHWPGAKMVDDLPAYYGLASAFILPSTREPWGLAVNEALACGLPVLASDRCGCVPELVFPGINGAVFDPLDPQRMAHAMTHISNGGVDLAAMGEASRRIVANHTTQTWAEALGDCIRAVRS